MSSTSRNIVRTLTRLLSEDELRSIESDPMLTQGIVTYVKEHLATHPTQATTPMELPRQDDLRGYYDEGSSDHKFDEHTIAPWTEVLQYDVATVFGRYNRQDIQLREKRYIPPILHREGIHSLRDLLLVNEAYLEALRGLGAKRVRTIVTSLAYHGMRLTDQRDLKDGQWIDYHSVRFGGTAHQPFFSERVDDIKPPTYRSLPYASFCNLPAVHHLPGIDTAAGREGVKVGELVEFLPGKAVILSLYTSRARLYVNEPGRLTKAFENLGFRVEKK